MNVETQENKDNKEVRTETETKKMIDEGKKIKKTKV